MDFASECHSSLSCKISIMQAKNLDFIKSHGELFVRFYLSAGNNKRIQLNTQEISSRSNLFWNQSFSLECLGTQDSIENLKQQSVIFELRWRPTNPFLNKIGGSQILGRAEIPWGTVMESPEMEMEKWVMMVSKKRRVPDGFKPPSVKIAMSVGVIEVVEKKKKKEKRNGRSKKWEDECGCCNGSGGRKCADYEVFALVSAFEAL